MSKASDVVLFLASLISGSSIVNVCVLTVVVVPSTVRSPAIFKLFKERSFTRVVRPSDEDSFALNIPIFKEFGVVVSSIFAPILSKPCCLNVFTSQRFVLPDFISFTILLFLNSEYGANSDTKSVNPAWEVFVTRSPQFLGLLPEGTLSPVDET